MADHDDTNDDINDDPRRISRRTAIKRGAIVGGTLVWATPVVMGMGKPAFAAVARTSPGQHGCCFCYNDPGRTDGQCFNDGINGTPQQMNADNCQNFCRTFGGGRNHYQYGSSASGISCDPSGPGCGVTNATGTT